MSEEDFEIALRDLIANADMNQLSVSIVLQNIADEQRDEFNEAE